METLERVFARARASAAPRAAMPRPDWRWVSAVAGVAAAYYAAARLGLLLELPGTNASPVWPPSGIGLAALMALGLRVWPGILAGAFLANLATLPGTPAGFAASAAIGVGNTLELVIALLLLRRLVPSMSPFERSGDVFRFVIVAGSACAVAATNGTASLALAGIIPAEIAARVWFTWWLGDTAGMLVLTPALYGWWRAPRLGLSGARALELALLTLLLAAATEILFGGWVKSEVIASLPYLFVLPGLLWAAFRFGPRETAALAVLVSGIVIARTVTLPAQSITPFHGPQVSVNESLLLLQIFVCAIAQTAIVLAAAMLEQRRAGADLRDSAAALRQANEALERSNIELQRFAYVASHDLQTPMRSIASFTGLLEATYADKLDARGKDWIRRTVQSIAQLQALVRDLLEYSRVDARDHPFERVPFRGVFDDAVALLDAPIREAGAQIACGELPEVMGDRSQLVQLMLNLLGNALKYRGSEPPRVQVSAEAGAGKGEWTFAVRDNGIGIAERHQERIFEIFQRLHGQNEIPGTGIGLAVCRRVLQRHGGRIWVESRPGRGSTFFFTIPALEGSTV